MTKNKDFWLLKVNFDCPCYLKFWPTDFLKSLSKVEDLLWAVWPLTRSFNEAVVSAHCFRKPGPKYSSGNSKSVASSGQGRWAGTIQELKSSEVSVTLPSSLRSRQLPSFSTQWLTQKPERFCQRPASRVISPVDYRRKYCRLWGNASSWSKESYEIGYSVAHSFSGQHAVVFNINCSTTFENLTFLLPQRKKPEVSKPWVHYTWGPLDTDCPPCSICS